MIATVRQLLDKLVELGIIVDYDIYPEINIVEIFLPGRYMGIEVKYINNPYYFMKELEKIKPLKLWR